MISPERTLASTADRGGRSFWSDPVVVGGLPVVFSRHAVARYCERVRAMSSVTAAAGDLAQIAVVAGRIVIEPPLWVTWQLRTPAYLMLGDDVVFPLTGEAGEARTATTCLVRGSFPPAVAARRRKQRRRR